MASLLVLASIAGCIGEEQEPSTPSLQAEGGTAPEEWTGLLRGTGGVALEFVPHQDGECRFYGNATGEGGRPGLTFGAGFRQADGIDPRPTRDQARAAFEVVRSKAPGAAATVDGNDLDTRGNAFGHWWASKSQSFDVEKQTHYQVIAAGTNLSPLPEDPDLYQGGADPYDWLEDWKTNTSFSYDLSCESPVTIESSREVVDVHMVSEATMEAAAGGRVDAPLFHGVASATASARQTMNVSGDEVLFLGDLGSDASKAGNLSMSLPDGRTVEWTPKPCAFGTGCIGPGTYIVTLDGPPGEYTTELTYAEVAQPELESFLIGLGGPFPEDVNQTTDSSSDPGNH